MSEAEAKKAAKSGDSQEIKEFVNREDLINSNVPKISIASIEPEQGPISGKYRRGLYGKLIMLTGVLDYR